MGGRGTFAAGNNVAYTYETVGKIEGIKVMEVAVEDRCLVADKLFNLPIWNNKPLTKNTVILKLSI